MKIKDLEQHCGDCSITEYCGSAYGYSICCDKRFGDVEEGEYAKIAETAQVKQFGACVGCDRPDCGVYRCGEHDFADEPCECDDEARDYYCEQIADHIEKSIKAAEVVGE